MKHPRIIYPPAIFTTHGTQNTGAGPEDVPSRKNKITQKKSWRNAPTNLPFMSITPPHLPKTPSHHANRRLAIHVPPTVPESAAHPWYLVLGARTQTQRCLSRVHSLPPHPALPRFLLGYSSLGISPRIKFMGGSECRTRRGLISVPCLTLVIEGRPSHVGDKRTTGLISELFKLLCIKLLGDALYLCIERREGATRPHEMIHTTSDSEYHPNPPL